VKWHQTLLINEFIINKYLLIDIALLINEFIINKYLLIDIALLIDIDHKVLAILWVLECAFQHIAHKDW